MLSSFGVIAAKTTGHRLNYKMLSGLSGLSGLDSCCGVVADISVVWGMLRILDKPSIGTVVLQVLYKSPALG